MSPITYHRPNRNVGFETRAREGAVLVLPTGANREELVDPSRIYSYVKDNAVSWYQYLNGHNGEEISVGTSNGALYVVIGIDRADSWATAVFPPVNADGIFKRKDLKFKYMEGKARTPWEDDGKHVVQYQSKSPPKASPGAVFLRLMAIALSPVEWTRYIAYTRPEAIPRYPILSAPKSELQERLQRFLSRFMDVSNDKYHVRKVRPSPMELLSATRDIEITFTVPFPPITSSPSCLAADGELALLRFHICVVHL